MLSPISDMDPIIVEVFRQLQHYDPLDLLVTIAALQLCPENADHAIRLDALAFAAASFSYETGRPQISRHRINRICNAHPLGDGYIRSQEDPCDNPFTEAFTFFGGSYIVFPGIVEDVTFILRHLLSAMFQHSAFDKHKPLMDKVHNLVLAILVVSDEIAKRAGLVRNIEPLASEDIYIPADLNRQKHAVLFTIEELEKTLIPFHLSLSDLAPFIQVMGTMELEQYSIDTTPLHIKPIIHAGDSFVISEPGILLASLRYQILLESKNAGLLSLLSQEYQTGITHTVAKSLELFGLKQVRDDFPGRDNKLFIHDGLWTFDTDKALYVTVVTDDFSDFEGQKVFEVSPKKNIGDLLDKYIVHVEEEIFSEAHNLNEIFVMIVFSGVGRIHSVGFNLDNLKTDPNILSLTAEELEVLSLIYGYNPMILYQFARDSERLRRKAQFISFSTLDEFETYRRNNFSFYISDDAKPTAIVFSPGDEKVIRLEALKKYDKHAVQFWEPGRYVEVYNLYNSTDIPIYVPLNFERLGEWFVELYPLPVWVIVDRNLDESDLAPEFPPAVRFVDLITYWLWQFSDELKLCLNETEFHKPLVIVVTLDHKDDWKEKDNNKLLAQYPKPIECKLDVDKFQLKVDFHPSIHSNLDGVDNKGELMCMEVILHNISSLLANTGEQTASKKLVTIIPSILSKHARTPLKKKILVLHSGNNPQLIPGNPHQYRKVQEAERNAILDELGYFCSNDLKLPEGHIPHDKVVEVLNQAVAFYFARLEKIVSTLSSGHLLEFLVGQYEAIVTERASTKLTIPTQIACFGNIGDVVNDISTEDTKLNDAAISCRFLIEYVVSKPPKGIRPVSVTVFDSLMALASEIISRGQESDYSKYGLFDVQLSMLRSGRLGFDNQKKFGAVGELFMGSRSREQIDDAVKNFNYWWRPEPNRNPETMPQVINEFNLAYLDEFSLSLTDLSNFTSVLGEISVEFGHTSQLIMFERDKLKSKIIAIMGWNDKTIEQLIDFLSLKAREKFLEVPLPYQRADIYPWRMSRELSYMRRPLLISIRDDKTYVCWGVRHLFDSFNYIANGSTAGRLKPSYASPAMQKWLGKKHREDGKNYESS